MRKFNAKRGLEGVKKKAKKLPGRVGAMMPYAAALTGVGGGAAAGARMLGFIGRGAVKTGVKKAVAKAGTGAVKKTSKKVGKVVSDARIKRARAQNAQALKKRTAEDARDLKKHVWKQRVRRERAAWKASKKTKK